MSSELYRKFLRASNAQDSSVVRQLERRVLLLEKQVSALLSQNRSINRRAALVEEDIKQVKGRGRDDQRRTV